MTNNNTSIRDLQTFLRKISQYNNSVLSVIPDGIFGQQTEDSVKSFQTAYNLPVTGIADYPTWIKITSVHQTILENERNPDVLEAIPIYELPINPGDESPYIYLIQGMINVLSAINNAFLPLEITGVHDAATVNAIKKIQELSGTPKKGTVDKATWNNIAGIYSMLNQTDGV